MSNDNGGPAFPACGNGNETWIIDGMTLRDYFAAKAMQALIAHYGDKMHIGDSDGRTSLHFAAYDHADAMLKARNT